MDKLRQIGAITLEKFSNARGSRLTIHDDHIRRFAVQANLDVNLEGFKASGTWLLNFKRSHQIVSR